MMNYFQMYIWVHKERMIYGFLIELDQEVETTSEFFKLDT